MASFPFRISEARISQSREEVECVEQVQPLGMPAIGMRLGALACALALSIGCGDGASDEGPGGGNGNGSGPGSECGGGDDPFRVMASEANNFTFSSTIQFDVQKVAPRTLLDFDWSAVTQNFQGHSLTEAAGIDALVLIVWDIPPEDVAAKINEDADLNQHAKVSIQYVLEGGETSAPITAFELFGSPVTEEQLLEYLDPEVNDPATTSYTLIAQTGTSLGQGVQMIQAFQVDPGETTSTVTMTNSSTILEWEADLASSAPTRVPEGQPGVVIDWSQIAVHGYGGEFVTNRITEVLIGRLSKSVAEIEEDFLNLEFIAEDIWRGAVPPGVSLNLATLQHDETGAAFPGVTGSDTWVLGLLCKVCTNPTPWYITKVETCP